MTAANMTTTHTDAGIIVDVRVNGTYAQPHDSNYRLVVDADGEPAFFVWGILAREWIALPTNADIERTIGAELSDAMYDRAERELNAF